MRLGGAGAVGAHGQQVAAGIAGEGRHQPARVGNLDRLVEGRIVDRRRHQRLHQVGQALGVPRRLDDVAVEVVLVRDSVACRETRLRRLRINAWAFDDVAVHCSDRGIGLRSEH